jgi:aspartyl-tRNA(Asn)/glutamyl-tRNA(Gln) amidotransferase subunit A
MSGDPTALSLAELAHAIREKRVSSREATEASLDRIRQWQPALNCFIRLDAEPALAAADAADRDLAAGRLRGKLHGVPLAHKDMYYRAGTVATCGSKIRRAFVPETTATALARLDAAGALQLGTLNMAEFALGPTGHNAHYGHCRNPYHQAHITGGSSSGSGAGVAARLIAGALGSDTGGSIRGPAAICNLVGLKTTAGLVSRYGAMPLSQTLDTVGPLTRTVRDCAILTGVIAGHDPDDPTTATDRVPDYEAGLEDGVAGLRLGVPSGYFREAMTPEVERLFDSAVAEFRKAGAAIVEVEEGDIDLLNHLGTVVMSVEAATFHAKWIRARPEDYSDQVRARIEPGFYHPATRYLEALNLRGPMLARFAEPVFTSADALITPVLGMPVPTIAETDVGGSPGLAAMLYAMTRNTRPINYLGLPALSLPGGFTANGLPWGFQLVARPFADKLLFRIGRAYERATEWGSRAPSL